jgi:hypothetical protein
MNAWELPVLMLVIALAAVATLMAYVGALGVLGAVRLTRCSHCDHLTVGRRDDVPADCPFCRHPVITHPVHLRHRH